MNSDCQFLEILFAHGGQGAPSPASSWELSPSLHLHSPRADKAAGLCFCRPGLASLTRKKTALETAEAETCLTEELVKWHLCWMIIFNSAVKDLHPLVYNLILLITKGRIFLLGTVIPLSLPKVVVNNLFME